MSVPKSPKVIISGSLSTALVLGTLAATSSAALAVPAGGYGDLIEKVSPSVVFIEVETLAKKGEQPKMRGQMPEFGDLFRGPQQDGPRRGVGSGFIVSEDGMIVTNHHVIDGAGKVTVKLSSGEELDAEIVGSDPLTDIAVLKVDNEGDLSAITFGSSEEMRAGDEVVAMGNPFGLGGTVTSGIVSATSRNINSGPYDDFIQTDAAINRGNSGGPLFNNAGEVVGVNTSIFSPDGGSVGIGFAVPSDLVQTVVADLSDDGEITRGWLGVQIKPLPLEIADVLGFEGPKGAMIEAVMAESPAEAAGLKKGDIVLNVDDIEITELRDLTRAVADVTPDDTVELTILRKGKETILDVKIGVLEVAET